MHTSSLRKVGGSIMLAVPPALIDMLHLRPEAESATSRYVTGDWSWNRSGGPVLHSTNCSPNAIPKLVVVRKSKNGSTVNRSAANSSNEARRNLAR